MEALFKEQSQKIKIYLAKETINDPTEETVDLSYSNSFPIDAIVTEIDFTKTKWVVPGIITAKTLQIIVEKKRRCLLEQSYKIEINGEYYNGYKINGKMAMKQEGNYIRAYVYLKQEV